MKCIPFAGGVVSFPDEVNQRAKDPEGRAWRFDFDKHTGPVFLRLDGEPLKRQPGPRSPAWVAFDRWFKRRYRKGVR